MLYILFIINNSISLAKWVSIVGRRGICLVSNIQRIGGAIATIIFIRTFIVISTSIHFRFDFHDAAWRAFKNKGNIYSGDNESKKQGNCSWHEIWQQTHSKHREKYASKNTANCLYCSDCYTIISRQRFRIPFFAVIARRCNQYFSSHFHHSLISRVIIAHFHFFSSIHKETHNVVTT